MSEFTVLSKRVREDSWQECVSDLYGSSSAYAWSVEDHNAAGVLFSSAARTGRALDMECGRGTHAIPMASVADRVCVSDPDADAVAFLAARAQQDGVTNILPLIGSPFSVMRPEAFDLIRTQRTGRSHLIGVGSLLRTDGVLSVSARNNWSNWNPFQRRSDSSGKLPSLRSRIRVAGCNPRNEYVAIPSIEDIRVLIHARDPRGLAHFLRRRLPGLPLSFEVARILLPLLRSFGPGFVLSGVKGPRKEAGIPEMVGQALGLESAPVLPIIYANRGAFTAPVYELSTWHPKAIFRMAGARSLVHHEARVLSIIESRGPAALQEGVPKVLWTGSWGARESMIQTHLDGNPVPYPRSAADLGVALNRLADWLLVLRGIPLAKEEIHNDHLSSLDIYRSSSSLRETFGELSSLIWSAREQLLSGGMKPSLVHGDLHPGNMLESKDGLKVFDWEYAARSLIPFDWCHYIGAVFLDSQSPTPDAEEAVRSLHHAFFGNTASAVVLREATRKLLKGLDLSPNLLSPFLVLGLFDFVRRRYGLDHIDEFRPVLEQIAQGQGDSL